MYFNRVHVEVTNICGLACSFCPPKLTPSKTMSLEFFEAILVQVARVTKKIALHMMGDALTLSNLDAYLDLALKYHLEVELTTSGFLLAKKSKDTLFHPSVRQLNISLNSFNKNETSMSFDPYIEGVLVACGFKMREYEKPFINLRLWNQDATFSEDAYNNRLFEKLEAFFGVKIDRGSEASQRLAPKILLDFDDYFEWPNMRSEHYSDGFCYGLKSHFGILADGRVVPCCLDGEGVIELGNLHDVTLEAVLNGPRTRAIIAGFSRGEAIEELCKRCTYKLRFSKE